MPDLSELASPQALYYGTWLAVTMAVLITLLVGRRRLGRMIPDAPAQPVFLAGFVVAMTLLGLSAQPTGDEPHYLIMTQSLLQDADVDLRNNYEQHDELAYLPQPLPDAHVNIVGDTWWPVHGIGLPLLALPWFAVAGRPGVVVMLALITAAGLRALYALLGRVGFDGWPAGAATLLAALTLPVAAMSAQMFPEVPAFLLVAVSICAIVAPRTSRLDVALLLASVAILPWLHPKYALVVAALLLAIAVVRGRSGMRLLLAATGLAAIGLGGLLLVHWLLGMPLAGPSAVLLSNQTQTTTLLDAIVRNFVDRPEIGLAGSLLDQQSGLLVPAPVWVLAVPGAILLLQRRPRIALACLLVFLGVYLPNGAYTMWYGGFASPARMLTPAVPVLAVAIAAVLEAGRPLGIRLVAILALPSLAHAWLLTTLPSFTRYGDPATDHNYFIALVERATGLNLTWLFPSFRHDTPETWLTTAGYVIAIVALTVVVVSRAAPIPHPGQGVAEPA